LQSENISANRTAKEELNEKKELHEKEELN
jgi:hypothetical protein